MAEGRGWLWLLGLGAAGGIAYAVGSSTQKTPAKTTTTPTAKDKCDQLAKDAGDIISHATADDIPQLSDLLAKAQALGSDCKGVADMILAKLKDLGAKSPGDTTKDTTTGHSYKIIHGLGTVPSANSGDMLIVALQDEKNNVYVTPISYTGGGHSIFEKTLADLAVTKFKSQLSKSGITPSAFTTTLGTAVGLASVTIGAPPDLADGSGFAITIPGDVLWVVTAEQMKSDIGGEQIAPKPSPSPKASMGGWDDFGKKRRTNVNVYG